MENRVNELLLSSVNYLDNIKCDVTPGEAPFNCAVSACKNKFTSIEDHKKSAFKFHNFPKSNPHLFWKWLILCKLPRDTPIESNLKICSDHFTLDDYNRNLKEEFLNPGFKRSLKNTSVPSVNLGRPLTEDELKELNNPPSYPPIYPPSNPPIKIIIEVNQEKQVVNEPKGVVSVPEGIGERIAEVQTLEDSIAKIRKEIRIKLNDINNKNAKLTNLKRRFQAKHKHLLEITSLSHFSQAQIDLLKGKKKKIFWSDDDLAQAFTLRHMGGKDFYLYLKNTLNYPLPALSCVQAWAGNVF